ncbi:MAG: hypothetical protein L6282_02990 [Candidatus Methanoperedenaceae archaeon]|nr:hypothetical protein [Candidatus Methanoperedenaceae archaeon]
METNTAFRKMLGYSGEELQAMVFTELTSVQLLSYNINSKGIEINTSVDI